MKRGAGGGWDREGGWIVRWGVVERKDEDAKVSANVVNDVPGRESTLVSIGPRVTHPRDAGVW